MFTDSPVKFRNTSIGLSPLKQMNSTSSSFAKIRNKSITMRSSTFSSAKNSQGKLGNLKDELICISQDIQSTRETTKVLTQ